VDFSFFFFFLCAHCGVRVAGAGRTRLAPAPGTQAATAIYPSKYLGAPVYRNWLNFLKSELLFIFSQIQDYRY
jgi:hypothetical protein